MASQQQRGTICNAPSKWDLMMSIFEGKQVTFSLVWTHGNFDVVGYVTHVIREDGSGESYCVTLRSTDKNTYEGYYRTDKRTGHLKLVEK